jgi:hypothetical protein
MGDCDRVYNKGIEPLAHSQRDGRIALARRRGGNSIRLASEVESGDALGR